MAEEQGWAAWTFSRTGKLNAWSWHGIGAGKLHAWATLGTTVYIRKEGDPLLHRMMPDTFLTAAAVSADSTSVEAVTQWLDFGLIGKTKALVGLDADVVNVKTIEVYVSVGGDRSGVLAETIQIGSNDGGWTYNGEIIPLNVAGTEFKLRLIGDGNAEVQINRVTLYHQPLEAGQ